MGDKSPKAKQRNDKKKQLADDRRAADAKAKQAGQSRFPVGAGKGKP